MPNRFIFYFLLISIEAFILAIFYFSREWIAIIISFTLGLFGILRMDEFLFKPILKIEFNIKAPNSHRIRRGMQSDFKDSFFLRLNIHNNGNVEAKNVQVFIKKLYRYHHSQDYVLDQTFLPMNLTWAHFRSHILDSIPVKSFRHCDFGQIFGATTKDNILEKYGRQGDLIQPTILVVQTLQDPINGNHILLPNKYKITFVASASNAKPVEATYKFELKGKFDDWHINSGYPGELSNIFSL